MWIGKVIYFRFAFFRAAFEADFLRFVLVPLFDAAFLAAFFFEGFVLAVFLERDFVVFFEEPAFFLGFIPVPGTAFEPASPKCDASTLAAFALVIKIVRTDPRELSPP